jgi:sugar lactone lactonase YvrE
MSHHNASRLFRIIRMASLALAALLGLLLLTVKLRYGGGAQYPDVSTTPLVPAAALQTLVELPYPPGNVTSSGEGRIFFNTHPFTQSHRFTDAFLFELVAGVPRPYPDAAAQPELRFVFGMTVDAQSRLWLVSPATLERQRTRIIAYDLRQNTKVVDKELAPGVGRFAQDLRVSRDGRTLFLADTGAFRFTHAALLVVDIASWGVREVLAAHPSTQPQDLVMRTRSGPYRIGYGLLTFQVGVDGIALSADGEWLYYATMSHGELFRVRTGYLQDPALSPQELAQHLERVGKKPLSDGIELTADGSVLITDVENGGIARLDRAGQLVTLVRSPAIVWADGVTVTPGGDVLFTDSSIPGYIDPLLRPPARQRLEDGRPYRIYKFHLPGASR